MPLPAIIGGIAKGAGLLARAGAYREVYEWISKYLASLGGSKSKTFIKDATYFFLSQYLPSLLQVGALNGTNLAKMLMGKGFTLGQGGSVITTRDRRDWSTPLGGGGGPLEWGPNGGDGSGSGGPVGKWFGGTFGKVRNGAGPIVANPFGFGGGGPSVEDLLNQIYEDPISYWDKQVNPQAMIGASPYAEEGSWRDFLREQKAKDAEFAQELNQRLDEQKQEYVDKKMKKHYRKPKSQWAKELLTEGAGRIAEGFGEGVNIYNSALANALMQSASNAMTSRQAEMYGNPLMSGMPLLAGGRQAMGGIAAVAGKQIGNLLKNWSDNLATEFDTQRIMRLQLDNRQPGQVIDTIGRIGMRREKGRRE